MRLDRFLVYARFAKTRSAALALIEGGLRLNGDRVTKIATSVGVGSVLTFVSGPNVRVIRVEALPVRRGPPVEARACYTDLAIDAALRQT